VAGVLSIARITALPQSYLFYWRVPLALLTILACAMTLWRAVAAARATRFAPVVLAVLGAVVLVASMSMSVRIVRSDENGPEEAAARTILAALAARGQPGDDEKVLLRFEGPALLGLQATVVNELVRDGRHVVVDDDHGLRFGYARTADPAEVDDIWYVFDSGALASVRAAEPGARVIASATPLGADDEARMRELQRDVAAELTATGRPDLIEWLDDPLVGFALADVEGLDRDAITEIAALNERVESDGGCRCAIVAFTPGAQLRT
jgi:hypothetical protein